MGDAAKFGIGTERDATLHGTITIDSWNNIGRYTNVRDAFFIFDEQRLVGSGAWVRSFLRIAKCNRWIMLTATPGDTWMDYGPVFVANGLYNNLTQFKREHVVYMPYVKFPKIKGYLHIDQLEKYRNMILVEMPYLKHTNVNVEWIKAEYDEKLFESAWKHRWHVYENRPLKDVAELFRVMRKIVNTDPSCVEILRALMEVHPRIIVYYNFDYELEILRGLADEITVAEWNGHKKEQIPNTSRWMYLVQYQSGAEGWNCILTDVVICFSLNYSWKTYKQAQGRIDRLTTKFTELYTYNIYSESLIDGAIRKALENKRLFNERTFLAKMQPDQGFYL